MRGGAGGGGTTTYHEEPDERVEHALTTLALANTMEASAGEPQKGAGVGLADRRGAMGRTGRGAAARTHACWMLPGSRSYRAVPFPLQPKAFPALRRARRC